MKARWVLAAAMAAVVVVVAASASLAWARSAGSRHASALTPTASRSENITVHGQWRLEVRNPDGTVVSVVSFHNDPTQAAQAIATILARAFSPGFFWIQLGSSTANPACVSSGTPVSCIITDPADVGPYSSESSTFKNLTTSHTTFQSSITLNGSITAQRDGNVDQVSSNIWVCNPTTAPSTPCASSSFWPFTSRTLGSPVSLVTGQQLLVTVTLSFS